MLSSFSLHFFSKVKQSFLVLFIPLVFFIVGVLTLHDYGISWDEPIHFFRGQAYLNYILTGKVRFDPGTMVSYYQSNGLPAEYFLEKDDGHPPLNGILASVSNLVFYQELGWLGDIESYHLFNILASTLLVLVVVLFAWETYGWFAAIVSGLVISTYPLFFAESHFNIKDPAEAAFFALTIWAIWKFVSKKSPVWILVSSIGFGLALGTKFNILFSPLIFVPYLVVSHLGHFKHGWSKVIRDMLQFIKSHFLVLLVSFLIVVILVFGTWPFLWQDPITNFIFILKWYKDIGTGEATYGYFLPGGINAFAPAWILVTTPPVVLLLTTIGIIASIKRRSEKKWAPFLWILWFTIPIVRVVLPNTTIYGGVRQILEFLPAMALLAGLGAIQTVEWISERMLRLKKPVQILLLLIFIPHLFILVKLHPNENVYLNSLIGGLPGAKAAAVPYWGNSLGNAYLQATNWLNENAEPGAKVALVQGTSVNIPKITLRQDIAFSNSYWSGIYRNGEYLVELTHNDLRFYPYAWGYIEKFLIPVHEVTVDGVAIAKVWKNDLAHTKNEFKKKEVVVKNLNVRTNGQKEVILDVGKTELLTRLVIFYPSKDCEFLSAEVSSSESEGNWITEGEQVPVASQLTYQEAEKYPYQAFFFAGRVARFVKLVETKDKSCVDVNSLNFKIYVLED